MQQARANVLVVAALCSWSFACAAGLKHARLRRAIQGSACEAELGTGFLDAMRQHQVALCSAPEAAAEEEASRSPRGPRSPRRSSVHLHNPPLSSDIVLYRSTPEPGCSNQPEAHVAILENVSMEASSSELALHVACEDHGLERINDYERGGAPIIAEDKMAASACTHEVEEDTILINNPRNEYYSNLYHTMEEVFSMSETATLLGRDVKDFRFLISWNERGRQRFFQFGSQVDGGPPESAPPKSLTGIMEMWSALVARGAKQPKLAPLPLTADALSASTSICFRRLVLPMRACDGSILPRTWSEGTPCAHGSRIAEKVSSTILQAFGSSSAAKHPGGHVVTFVVRRTSRRGLLNSDAVAEAISELDGVTLRQVDFGGLSFAEQVKAVQGSDVLVGVHGAGLTHIMLLPQGAGIVEISPNPAPYPGRSVANIFANMAAWTEHPYRAVHTAFGGLDSSVEARPEEVAEAVSELLRRQQ